MLICWVGLKNECKLCNIESIWCRLSKSPFKSSGQLKLRSKDAFNTSVVIIAFGSVRNPQCYSDRDIFHVTPRPWRSKRICLRILNTAEDRSKSFNSISNCTTHHLSNSMSSFRVARAITRVRPSTFRSPVFRRGYADVASDKIKLSLTLPHQV